MLFSDLAALAAPWAIGLTRSGAFEKAADHVNSLASAAYDTVPNTNLARFRPWDLLLYPVTPKFSLSELELWVTPTHATERVVNTSKSIFTSHSISSLFPRSWKPLPYVHLTAYKSWIAPCIAPMYTQTPNARPSTPCNASLQSQLEDLKTRIYNISLTFDESAAESEHLHFLLYNQEQQLEALERKLSALSNDANDDNVHNRRFSNTTRGIHLEQDRLQRLGAEMLSLTKTVDYMYLVHFGQILALLWFVRWGNGITDTVYKLKLVLERECEAMTKVEGTLANHAQDLGEKKQWMEAVAIDFMAIDKWMRVWTEKMWAMEKGEGKTETSEEEESTGEGLVEEYTDDETERITVQTLNQNSDERTKKDIDPAEIEKVEEFPEF